MWNGLGLQMLLYLFTLEERGEGLYGLPVEGAGVLYLPARDAVVRGSRTMSEEERQKAVDKELRPPGIGPGRCRRCWRPWSGQGRGATASCPCGCPKAQGQITGEALVSAERLGQAGEAHPAESWRRSAGNWRRATSLPTPSGGGRRRTPASCCDYAAACHFEEGRGGDRRRWLPGVKAQEFWENVERETD